MPSADGTEARKTLNTNPCLCSPVVPRRHVVAAFSNEKRTRDNKTMALSQCLDDSPAKWPLKRGNHNHLNLQELYNERHRLALEELVSGGVENFLEFLRKERIPNFLSDDEMQRIAGAAVLPPRYSSFLHGDELEQSVSASMDCSSVTYFPEVSDVEPPPLENGWPAFTTGSYRGVTRAVAHFQPSYGEVIYSCKEAARRMIKSAKELIAIVTDGLTDLDIFKDLQEACTQRKVPIYILLDHSCAPAFLKMCRDISVGLGELPLMQVRTITGGTYFMRSGAKITGKVHERFMLIDGNRVATGSYRFNWTDGKLNSSNLIELSGQVTENFDEEFRVLYAQSVPISARGPPSARNSGIFGHLLIKQPLTSSPLRARDRPIEAACLPSTPSRKPPAPEEQPPCDPLTGEKGQKSSPVSNSSTIGEDWAEPGAQEEILAGSTQCFPTGGAPAAGEPVSAPALSCHVSTQTTRSTVDTNVQTDPESVPRRADPLHSDHLASGTQDQPSPSSGSSSISPGRRSAHHHPPSVRCRSVGPENNLRDCFHKLTRERQQHYSTIRTKLEHMVTVLSQGRELVDVTNTAVGPGRGRGCKAQRETGQGQNPGLLVQSAGMGTWPKARCLH